MKLRSISRWLTGGSILILTAISLSIQIVVAQKKPEIIRQSMDVKAVCKDVAGTPDPSKPPFSQDFCVNYNGYIQAIERSDPGGTRFFRDELIKDVILKVDRYYEDHKNRKKSDRAILQTIFDVLEIGASVAISISNGERVKSVIAESLNGFQAGRSSLNDNFDLLKTKVLINKMRENRAKVLTKITTDRQQDNSGYSWTDAKIDLQNYFFAGTFSNALDSLVGDTGDAANNAETDLKRVAKRPIVSEATPGQRKNSVDALAIRQQVVKDLADPAKKADTTNKLKKIVTDLAGDDDAFIKLFEEKGISGSTSDGQQIFDVLRDLRETLPELNLERGRTLVDKINKAFVDTFK